MMPADFKSTGFAASFLSEVRDIAARLDTAAIEKMAALLAAVREQSGRLFILGVGGSAANASHAVNDFRKLAGIEAYAPTDNVSELTARTNDEGWTTVFAAWLQVSHLGPRDAVLIFSVGGGSVERNVSPNIVTALDYARSVGAKTLGIVGRDGGYTATVADACVIIPTVHPDRITPHSEAFQAVVWHLLVSHPVLQKNATKWESLSPMSQRRAVFLDRDGVLNDVVVRDGKPFPPERVDDLHIPDGTAGTLERLKDGNFMLLVVTNQPDVARGMQSREVVEAMASRLRAELPLDEIFTCFHDDRDNCTCRKPRPGLMVEAANKYGINLNQSYLVGDRWRDIDAGAKAGCRTIWIDRGYVERSPDSPPNARVTSLPEAVDWILNDSGRKNELYR
jgi:D-sedoheptulose 7-phosphate isomerase